MTKCIGMTELVEVAPGVSCLTKTNPSGWPISMHLVSLPDGLLVHSPTWAGEGTFEAVEALGVPRVLVAPNHFHHLSLARFRARFPDAIVIASDAARPGLRSRKHEGIVPLSEARAHLPEGAELLEPPGTKAGEVLLSLPSDDGRLWLVCDAFFGVERAVTGVEGVVLRLTKTIPGLSIGNTFRWLGLDDRRAYLGWLLAQIEEQRPTTLVMSHGDPISSPDLPRRLTELAKKRLP